MNIVESGHHLKELLKIFDTESGTVDQCHTYHLCYLLCHEIVPDRLAEHIRSNKENLSFCSKELEFFGKLISERPEVLTRYSEDVTFFQNLCAWIITKLLAITVSPECRPLRSEVVRICKCIIDLLNEEYALSLTKNLALELQNLHRLNCKLEFETCTFIHVFSLASMPLVVRFADGASEDLSLESVQIELDDIEPCECVQSAICMLLVECTFPHVERHSDFVFAFWMDLLHQLELADVELKLQTLRLIVKLVESPNFSSSFDGSFLIDDCLAFCSWLTDTADSSNREFAIMLSRLLDSCCNRSFEVIFRETKLNRIVDVLQRVGDILLQENFSKLESCLRTSVLQFALSFTYCIQLYLVEEVMAERMLGDRFQHLVNALLRQDVFDTPAAALLNDIVGISYHVVSQATDTCCSNFALIYYPQKVYESLNNLTDLSLGVSGLKTCEFLITPIFKCSFEKESQNVRCVISSLREEVSYRLLDENSGLFLALNNVAALPAEEQTTSIVVATNIVGIVFSQGISAAAKVATGVGILSLPWISLNNRMDLNLTNVSRFTSLANSIIKSCGKNESTFFSC
ncbi:hypothetical protein TTRE_0000615601 [Trichuris trichiura]|uniref:Uncharacterized protein n=1 Tax=Trichuris trichiura TaxID=36087 RepID=A0A077ZGV9_TRITR|nr:hypothetical protein TTRE_0000615601 [Trichuris trichiura]